MRYFFRNVLSAGCLLGHIHHQAFAAVDWDSLAESLSTEATLHGPFQNNLPTYAPCFGYISDAFKISKGNNGLCMHAHACNKNFCEDDQDYDLPLYSTEVKTDSDVSSVFAFAAENDLSVSVKTTGHSYQGSSTKAGSIMIWMQNFEKDLSIVKDFSNSCTSADADAKITHDVIGIGGGAVWDDVIEAVKGDYHIVTGGGRTVSAIGGWLQGGGLSFSSRLYGIGVDQAIDFTVVLTNGTVVKADACANSDLFWAMRGGGGGTYGVVTHVHYKVHEVTPIVQVQYRSGILPTQYYKYGDKYEALVDQWLDFWIQKSPALDPRWCGGFFDPESAHLLFCGSLEDAETTFLNEFRSWYSTELDWDQMVEGVWGSYIEEPKVFESWYEYKGGADAYQNPAMTDPTGTAYTGAENLAARLMPKDVLLNKPTELKNFLKSIRTAITGVNYFLGGNINSVSADSTAVHPALRSSAWSLITVVPDAAQAIREFIPNEETGVCYNHHYRLEPDWRNACWGANYGRLSELKTRYDPIGLLGCWHCVGYKGDDPTSQAPNPAPTPAPTTESSAWTAYSSVRNLLYVPLFTGLLLSWYA